MKNYFLLILLTLIVSACKKSNSPSVILSPEKTELVYPAQNSICIEGNIISAAQSSIVFKWGASVNTESYELNLKNLSTGESNIHTSLKPELELTLLRSTPYSWTVTSKTSKTSTTAQSELWKFYNSGPGTESYAPFPADIISPLKGQNITATAGKIILDWEGSDADGDIINYDIFLSSNPSPALIKSNISESKLIDVAVSGSTTYYWKVITKDSKGNSSESGIFNFTVN